MYALWYKKDINLHLPHLLPFYFSWCSFSTKILKEKFSPFYPFYCYYFCVNRLSYLNGYIILDVFFSPGISMVCHRICQPKMAFSLSHPTPPFYKYIYKLVAYH